MKRERDGGGGGGAEVEPVKESAKERGRWRGGGVSRWDSPERRENGGGGVEPVKERG